MSANHQMALRVVWATRIDDDTPAPDARELLAMCGLIEPDGNEILPDIVAGLRISTSMGRTGQADPPPLRREPDEPPPRYVTTPPGLRLLPPPAALVRRTPASAAKPKPQPRAKPKPRPVSVETAPPPVMRKSRPTKPTTAVKSPRPPRQLPPIDHGTLTGHSQHSHRKLPIPPDDPCGCRAARKAYDDARNAAKKAAAGPKPTPKALPAKRIAPVLPPIEHGTVEGWQAHQDRGALPVCEACEAAVAPPPPPDPIPPDDWLAKAQRSPHRAVARAAALAIGLRLRIEVATSAQLADGRLLARLDAALDDVAGAQARAPKSRRTGAT